MTNAQINRLVAEELGYRVEQNQFGFYQLKRGDDIFSREKSCDNHAWGYVPDFCEDHNAIAEMRKWISGACECQFFMEQLRAMVHACHMTFAWEEDWLLVAATPRQQAEAFLRMRGKWREG